MYSKKLAKSSLQSLFVSLYLTSEEESAWRVEQINFTTGVRGSIDEVAFSKNLAKILVPANKVKAIRERQAR